MIIENNIIVSICQQEDGTNIVIPKNAVGIQEENGYVDFERIDSITVEDGNPVFYVQDGALINRETKMLITADSRAIMPNDGSVQHIGCSAFAGRKDIPEKITIPANIKSVGKIAFAESNVKTVIFEGDDCYIDNLCFLMSNLRHLILPKNLSQVGVGIVSGCKSCQIILDENNSNYYTNGDCLVDERTNSVVACTGAHVNIPFWVEAIDDCASVCLATNAPNVSIPSSVKKIGVGNCFKAIDANENTYAHKYAVENSIKFREKRLGNRHAYVALDVTGLENDLDGCEVYCYSAIIDGERHNITFDELARPTHLLSEEKQFLLLMSNDKLKNARPTHVVRREFLRVIEDCIIVGRNIPFMERVLGVKFDRYIDICDVESQYLVNRLKEE